MNTPRRNGNGKKRGAYVGRLSFDPATEFHTDLAGRRVVTEDGGKTWRYAKKADTSHNARYQQQVTVVDTTVNQLARLALVHGMETAEKLLLKDQPHHFEPQPGDPHYEKDAVNADGVVTHTRLQTDPDEIAVTVTSHTEAWGG